MLSCINSRAIKYTRAQASRYKYARDPFFGQFETLACKNLLACFVLLSRAIRIMARLSLESRQRVITLFSRGYTVTEIRRRLCEEITNVSSQALHNLLRKFHEKRTIKDLPRRRRPRKLTEEMKAAIEEAYRGNDELTSTEIKRLLVARWPDLRVSVAAIKHTRKEIGWVCTRPHYCQLL